MGERQIYTPQTPSERLRNNDIFIKQTAYHHISSLDGEQIEKKNDVDKSIIYT